MALPEIINPIAVAISTISTVYLLQEKFMSSGHVLSLSKTDTIVLRSLVSVTNAIQLTSLLVPPTWPMALLNTVLALSKIFIVKKF
jgi:hypothetical protein